MVFILPSFLLRINKFALSCLPLNIILMVFIYICMIRCATKKPHYRFVCRRWVNVPKSPDPFQRSLVSLAPLQAHTAMITTTSSKQAIMATSSPPPPLPDQSEAGSRKSDGYAESMARVDQWLNENNAVESVVGGGGGPSRAHVDNKRYSAEASVGSDKAGVLSVAKEDVVKGVMIKGIVCAPKGASGGGQQQQNVPPATGEVKRKAPKPPAQKKSNASKSKKR